MTISESEASAFREHHLGREINREDTLEKYLRWARRFELWRGPDVNEDEVRQFDGFLQSDDRLDYPWENYTGRPAPDSYAYSSRVIAVSALKWWIPWKYDERLDTKVQNIVKGEPDPFDPTIVPKGEVQRTIQNARDDCNCDGCQAALQVGYDAIMRGAEVTKIEREDVNLADGQLYVRAVKGSNNTTIGISEKTASMLRAHMDKYPNRETLFHNSYGRPWKPNSFNTHFRRYHHDAGSHAMFRHSAIVHRLNSGEGFGSVYRRSRHRHSSQTAEYGRVVDVDVPAWAAGGEE